jgi:peptidase M48-like protein
MEFLLMSYFISKYRSNLKKWLIVIALCVTSQSLADEPDEKDFPQEEYEHYMKLIAEIDPDMHEALKQCAIDLDGPCIDRALAGEEDRVMFGTEETEGYPILVMNSLMDRSLDAQKERLKKLMGAYKKHVIPPMKAAERQKLLNGLKTIDPDLYDAIIAVDPTGENHIKRSQKVTSAYFYTEDGLPLFYVDKDLVDGPYEETLFVLAHELSHYVLDHIFRPSTVVHREFSKEVAPQEFKIKGKKVAGQLPFVETFQKARTRIQETEADRMAVIDFGIPIEDALCWLEKARKDENRSTTTFQRTHPFAADRIKYLRALCPEIELRKAQKKKRKKIDYNALAADYLQRYTKYLQTKDE